MINSDVLWHHAARRPDKAAIIWDGKTYTYADLAVRVRRLANALVGLGIGKGERVGLLATNCVEHAETVFALSEIGALWVPLNYRLTPSEVGVIVGGVECAALVYSADVLETVEALRDEGTGIRHWICIGDGAKIGDGYDSLLDKASDAQPPRRAVPEDLFAIMHTSGTTGLPKGAMLTPPPDAAGVRLLGDGIRDAHGRCGARGAAAVSRRRQHIPHAAIPGRLHHLPP